MTCSNCGDHQCAQGVVIADQRTGALVYGMVQVFELVDGSVLRLRLGRGVLLPPKTAKVVSDDVT